MKQQAHHLLNLYLDAELGSGLVLPNVAELRQQRENFLMRFGPERLAAMSSPELLRELPYNVSNDQPMDYWLEFKNDEEFQYRLFGSIAGGSAAKFGAWQDKDSRSWRAKQPGKATIQNIGEDEALITLENRRKEMLAALAAVGAFLGQSADAIDPQSFEDAVQAAAPRWGQSAWLHKYLHLNFPELVTWNATLAWSEAELYRVGVVPQEKGLYAQDIQIIRFWNSLSALSELPIEQRYRTGTGRSPRDHWCLRVDHEREWLEMIAQGQLSLGPAAVGSLSETLALTRKRDVQQVIASAFQDADLNAQPSDLRDLTELCYGLKEGSIIALFSKSSTVVAVGEVNGSYHFAQGLERPHLLPVRWYHQQSFQASAPLDFTRHLLKLEPRNPVVADIEASLLVNAVGPWEGIAKKDHQSTQGAGSNEEVAQFLERLAQIHKISELEQFKSRAYQRSADVLRESEDEVSVLAQEGRLRSLPTIGEVIEKDIQEFLQTGTSEIWTTLTAQYPESLLTLLDIPGFGGMRVRRVFLELGVRNLEDLRAAVEDGRLSRLPGFGPSALEAVRNYRRQSAPEVEVPPLEGLASQVAEMLERKRQVIFYGPPGTGKTYHAERIALEMVSRQNFKCVPSQLSDKLRKQIYRPEGASPYIATCTFHPMYSYEDFIEGYRPDGDGFKLEAGIFKRMVEAAQKRPDKVFVLIIDEINRGNIPKIFGELITLIEASKRGRSACVLPLSKEIFSVPENLLVIGTMNTADRSILLLDTALRRRFAFKELLPEPHLLRSGSIGEVSLSSWLRALNRRIVEQLGRDGRNLQVGHAYFMPSGKPASTLARVAEIVRDEIWPLLQEYCYEDAHRLANILAADRGGAFCRQEANLRFELFEPGREDELTQALLAIVTPDDKKQDALLDEDLFEGEESEELLEYLEVSPA